jgi:hypothetical protein
VPQLFKKGKTKVFPFLFGSSIYYSYICIEQLKTYTMEKIIKLLVFGIVVTIDYDEQGRPISGNISTELHEDGEDEGIDLYNACMDAIESMVLAHAMAEVDITSNGYIEGLDTAVNACAGNY